MFVEDKSSATHAGVDVNVSRLLGLIASPFGRLTDGRLMVYAHIFNPHNFILSYRPKMYLALRWASLKGQAIYDVFSVSCYAYIHHDPKSSSSSCSILPWFIHFHLHFFFSKNIHAIIICSVRSIKTETHSEHQKLKITAPTRPSTPGWCWTWKWQCRQACPEGRGYPCGCPPGRA